MISLAEMPCCLSVEIISCSVLPSLCILVMSFSSAMLSSFLL